MGKPIEIPFLANVWNALRGFKNLESGLDEVSDSLDDVARDAKRAGDDLGDNVKGGAKEAEQSTERLERSFKDLRDEARRSSRQAGDDLGDNIKRGADRGARAAGEASEEIRDEFKSNLSEVTSSFRGDLESLGDLAQGTLGGLVSGLGPVGLAVGAAGALGIGLVMGATEQATERTEQYKARVAELSDAYIESGQRGALSFSQVADKLRQLATEGDDVAGTLADIFKRAEGAGLEMEDLTSAFAGNSQALDDQIAKAKLIVSAYDQMAAAAGSDTSQLDGNLSSRARWAAETVRKLEEVQKANNAAKENQRLYLESGAAALQRQTEQAESYADSVTSALDEVGASYKDQDRAITDQIKRAQEVVRSYDEMAAAAQRDGTKVSANATERAGWARQVIATLRGVQDENRAAQRTEEEYLASGIPEMVEKATRLNDYAESIQDNLTSAGESWEKYQDAETGALDLEAYNANIEARVLAMQMYQTNMQTLHGQISDDAYNYLVSLGANAAPLLQAYADAPNDQKERTAANWAALGAAASAEYTDKLKAGIPTEFNGPTVKLFLDTDPYDNWIAGLPRQIQGPDVLMQTKVQGAIVP